MATDLKDTPLAYSVITKEFLDALAIKDTETAMDWAVNSYQSRGDAQDRIQNLGLTKGVRLWGLGLTRGSVLPQREGHGTPAAIGV